MLTKALLGRYLDRDVWLAEINHPSDLNDPILDNSTMLIVFGDAVPAIERQEAFDAISAREPITVMVAGNAAKVAWNELADRVYLIERRKLTMAFNTDDASAIGRLETFFFCSMPGEDRWDEWSGYVIVGWREDMSPYVSIVRAHFTNTLPSN